MTRTNTRSKIIHYIILNELVADPTTPVFVACRSGRSANARVIEALRAYTQLIPGDIVTWTARDTDDRSFVNGYVAFAGTPAAGLMPPRSVARQSRPAPGVARTVRSLDLVITAGGRWKTLTATQRSRPNAYLKMKSREYDLILEAGHAGRRIETKVVFATETVRLDARLLN